MKIMDINGIPVSRLIMGTGDLRKLGGTEILDAYVAAGGMTFDTAHQYRQAEVILGKWMRDGNIRSRLTIMTKGAHHDDGSPGPRVDPLSIRKDLTESLERLETDYIDLYALHRDEPDVPVGPVMEELHAHVAAGRVRAIGASNWTYRRIQEANDFANLNGLTPFSFSSTNLALAEALEPRWAGSVSADRDTCAWHERNQMPLLAWSAQAGGFFSGLFTPDDRTNSEMVRVYYSSDNWERYERARRLAEKKGVSAIQIALTYVLNRSFPTAAIIGPRIEKELSESLQAISIPVTAAELAWLNLEREEPEE